MIRTFLTAATVMVIGFTLAMPPAAEAAGQQTRDRKRDKTCAVEFQTQMTPDQLQCPNPNGQGDQTRQRKRDGSCDGSGAKNQERKGKGNGNGQGNGQGRGGR